MVADYGQPLDEHLFTNGSSKPKKVAYFYDSDVGNYAYVAGHPMKPHRIRVAHSLIMNYGCYKKMEIYRAKPATKFEMTQFHTDEYVDFLQRVTPDNMDNYSKEQSKYNVGDDCPVFDGLFEFCGISAGGSMEGAARLNRNRCDVAVNWAGGLHHAKKSEASGFCYVNDIVLGIIELLRFHQRVLYIDIDVHHGDGVEEAFYTTDRVMTASFHKYGEYFPGTGELRDIGVGQGKYHSVNFPLRDGITDASYRNIFEPVITSIMEYYKPQAVVLQCGGDSLSGDRLGCFNLSMRGHANCVRFVKSFNLPTLVLGGGGYTMRNVARTWAFETGTLIGMPLNAQLPYNDYYEYFAPDYELDVKPSNMDNANTPEYLEKIKNSVIENLRRTAATSTQLQDVPRQPLIDGMDSDAEDDADDMDADQFPDVRNTQRRLDKRVQRDDEFEDSDNEEMVNGETNGLTRRPRPNQRPRVTDFKNPHADADIDIDEDGKEIIIPGANVDTEMGDGSREENHKIEEQKAAAALSLSPRSKASQSPRERQSPANGADEDEKDDHGDSPEVDDGEEEDEGDDEDDEDGDADEMDVDDIEQPAAEADAHVEEEEEEDDEEAADETMVDEPAAAETAEPQIEVVAVAVQPVDADEEVEAAAALLLAAPALESATATAAGTQPTPPDSPQPVAAPAPAQPAADQPATDVAEADFSMAEVAADSEPAAESAEAEKKEASAEPTAEAEASEAKVEEQSEAKPEVKTEEEAGEAATIEPAA